MLVDDDKVIRERAVDTILDIRSKNPFPSQFDDCDAEASGSDSDEEEEDELEVSSESEADEEEQGGDQGHTGLCGFVA